MTPSLPITATIVRRHAETADIVTFELAAADGQDLPAFEAGAHIDVEVAPGITRQYSLCNSPEETHRYIIGVLKDPASRGGSVAMHRLQPGQALRISEPRNHFSLTQDASFSLLLAGGIGVTPLLAMAETLTRDSRPFALHYCARSPEHMAFRERIAASAFADRARLHFDNGAEAQRLNLNAALGGLGSEDHIYVCGPTGFIDWVLAVAQETGIADTHIHREFFSASPVSDGAAFKVTIASTGAVIPVAKDRTVAQALADHGIDIPLSCESGVCGTCLTGIIAGTPDHRDVFLTPAEQEAGDQFLPCCSRAKTPTLVLDL